MRFPNIGHLKKFWKFFTYGEISDFSTSVLHRNLKFLHMTNFFHISHMWYMWKIWVWQRVTFETWDPSDIWSKRQIYIKIKRQKGKNANKQKGKKDDKDKIQTGEFNIDISFAFLPSLSKASSARRRGLNLEQSLPLFSKQLTVLIPPVYLRYKRL